VDETEYSKRVMDAEGPGFSLTLCKMIAQFMGGKAQVSHGNRDLNRFTIEIPLRYEDTKVKMVHGKQQEKPEDDAKPIVDLSPYHILLVENNTKENKLTGPIFRINGAQVTITYSLEEAESAWNNSSEGYYSMILTDRDYQDGSCWDLAEAVRQSDRKDSKKIPVVVMSETVLVDDIKRGFRQGINANIPKPVDLKRILQILEVFKGGNSLC
jgi:CheY-like chemotaxis protein